MEVVEENKEESAQTTPTASAGYSLRKRKPRTQNVPAIQIVSDEDEKDESDEELQKPKRKRRRKKANFDAINLDDDEDDPDFHLEDEQSFGSPQKRKQAPPFSNRSHLAPHLENQNKKFVPILPKVRQPLICAVKTCQFTLLGKTGSSLTSTTIYPFPTRKELHEKWIKLVRPIGDSWSYTPLFGVCAKHFASNAKPFFGDAPTLDLPVRRITLHGNQQIFLKSTNSPAIRRIVTNNSNTASFIKVENRSGAGFQDRRIMIRPGAANEVSQSNLPNVISHVPAGTAVRPSFSQPTMKVFRCATPNNQTTQGFVLTKSDGTRNVIRFSNIAPKIVTAQPQNAVSDPQLLTAPRKLVLPRCPSSFVRPQVSSSMESHQQQESASPTMASILSKVLESSLQKQSATKVRLIRPSFNIRQTDNEVVETANQEIDLDIGQQESSLDDIVTKKEEDNNDDGLAFAAISVVEEEEEDDGEVVDNAREASTAFGAISVVEEEVDEDHVAGLPVDWTDSPKQQQIVQKPPPFLVNKSRNTQGTMVIKNVFSLHQPQQRNEGVVQRRIEFSYSAAPQNANSAIAVDEEAKEILGRFAYKGETTFFCSICNLHMYNCERENVCRHVVNHRIFKTLYECRLCGSIFDSFNFLFCHWKRRKCFTKLPHWMCTLNGNLCDKWVCFVCGISCAESRCNSLVHHISLMHPDLRSVDSDSSSAANGDFRCAVCDVKFHTTSWYLNHVGRTHYHLCDVYGSDDAVSMKIYESTVTVNQRCAFGLCECQDQNLQIKYGQVNQQCQMLTRVRGASKYMKCSQCLSNFENLHDLFSHTYKCVRRCTHCVATFYDPWSLSAHQILSHWLVQCPYCELRFRNNDNAVTLLKHFLMHYTVDPRDLAYDRMCGYPTPLLFENGPVYFCSCCHDDGSVLYFATQSCLTRYHKFLPLGKRHMEMLRQGNADSCVRNHLINESAQEIQLDVEPDPNLKEIKKEIEDDVTVIVPERSGEQCHEKEVHQTDVGILSAISTMNEAEEDGSVESIPDDEVAILPFDKPEPPIVDLALEDNSKSKYLHNVKPLDCWCRLKSVKRSSDRHRRWALRVSVSKWPRPSHCYLCKRKSKNFLTNVKHVCDHLKCFREFCEYCGEGFNRMVSLQKHMQTCQPLFYGEREMRVLIEEINVVDEDELPGLPDAEYLNEFTAKELHECEETDNELRLISINGGKETVCGFIDCLQVFPNADSLFEHHVGVHLREKWTRGGRCYLCPERQTPSTPSALRKHILEVHRSEILVQLITAKKKGKRQRKQKFCSEKSLKQKRDKKKDMESQSSTSSGVRTCFRCLQCSMDFRTLDEYESHMWTVHTDADEFQCSICKESFGNNEELAQHVQSTHQKYFCPKCLQNFTSRSKCSKHVLACEEGCLNADGEKSLKEKLKQMGLDESRKRCELCSLNFTTGTKFKGHVRLHCGQYLAKCNSCAKTFFQWKQFFLHKKSCKISV